MIKECKILNYNQSLGIVVISVDNMSVQFPYKGDISDKGYVLIENHSYSLLSNDEYLKMTSEKPRKKVSKKTLENECADSDE